MTNMLWVLLIIVLLLILLFSLPLELEIDTDNNLYQAQWRGIFMLRGEVDDLKWRWYFRLFFFENEWQPSRKPIVKKAPSVPKQKKKKKPPFTLRQIWALMNNMRKAVDVKYLRLNLDTGDFVQNAYWYPVFHVLSKDNRQLSINFGGQETFSIHLQTRLYRLAWAFLKVFIPKFKRS